jgi:hypothetical protein
MTSSQDGDSDHLTTWTLGAIKRRNLALEGYCQTPGCGHFYVFDIDKLIALAGPDYRVPTILPDVACTKCGGELKFWLAMTQPTEQE